MSLDSSRFKSHAAAASVVAVMLAAAAGCWAFAVSLRPCRVRLDPGTLVSYRLTSGFSELRADGAEQPPVIRESEISLVCIGADNEVALVSPGGSGQDEVTLLSFAGDGSARLIDGDQRASDQGKALGFFDFNLLPLPRQATDQTWTVPLVYSALPPAKRNVQGKVRRVSNSAKPEFQLKLPTIEWVNERSRYQRVGDLVCTYRFDTALGIVDRATVKCQAGIELDDGSERRWQVRIDLDLAAVQRGRDDIGALRDLALASSQMQDELVANRRTRQDPLLRRLADSDVQDPRLRAVARQLLAQAGAEPAQAAVPTGADQRKDAAPPAWAARVCTLATKSRARADRCAKDLAVAGFPAYVAAVDARRVAVMVGPYANRDPQVLVAIAKRSHERPVWFKMDEPGDSAVPGSR